MSDECFDGIQFTDCFLYVIRQKIEGNENHPLVKVFNKHFLGDALKKRVKHLDWKEIYYYDMKFNYFEEKSYK